MVAPAFLTARAMGSRPSPSTEQGPAMTWKLPPPILTPWPQSTTVSSGWNLRLAFLKGSETRLTWSMMSIDSSRNGSMRVVSPMMPTIVSFSPLDTFVLNPRSSIHRTKWSSCSGVAESFTIAIISAFRVPAHLVVLYGEDANASYWICGLAYSKRYETGTVGLSVHV